MDQTVYVVCKPVKKLESIQKTSFEKPVLQPV